MAAPETLVHVDLSTPGFTRRKAGKGFVYLDTRGKPVRDRKVIDRLNAIALPPAYRNAWYAPDPNAHILATGLDAAGRRQYRYHPEFSAHRDALKFASCADFGAVLPRIRKQVERDLAGRKLTEQRAVASVIRLLDTGRIRVGNTCYARENGSYGATTLRRRHAQIEGSRLKLRFKAKSGKLCKMRVSDRGLIRFVKQTLDLPGQHLFQFCDEEGAYRPISSSHVNDYIRDVSGEDFTAKHFRTWHASVLALEWLLEWEEGRSLKAMLDHVSTHLGNTPAMARKAYVHPLLVEEVRNVSGRLETLQLPRRTKWLSRHERALITLLCEAG